MKKQYGIKLLVRDFFPDEPFFHTLEGAERVIWDKARGRFDLLIENIRYAGVVSANGDTFTIYAPASVVGAAWQSINLSRMRSFGIHAAAVVS